MATDDSQDALKNQIAELKAELVRAVLFEINREGRLDSDTALIGEISSRLDAAVSRSIQQNLNAEGGPLAALTRTIDTYSTDWAALLANVGEGVAGAEEKIGKLRKEIEGLSTSQAASHLETIAQRLTQIDESVIRLGNRIAQLEAGSTERSLRDRPQIDLTPAPTPLPRLAEAPALETLSEEGTGRATAVPAGQSPFKLWVLRLRDRYGLLRIAGFLGILAAIALYFFGAPLWRMIGSGGADMQNAAAPVAPPLPRPPELPNFRALTFGLDAFGEVVGGTPTDHGTITDVMALTEAQRQTLQVGVHRVRTDIDVTISELAGEPAIEAARRLRKEDQRGLLMRALQETGEAFSRVDSLLNDNLPARPPAERTVRLSELNQRARALLAAVAAFELSAPVPTAAPGTNSSNGNTSG